MKRIAVILALMLLATTATAQRGGNKGPQVGKKAPEIAGEDIDGNAMKLSDYRGKVVVLDFWGDW